MKKTEDYSLSWYYVKGERMIGVYFNADYDEVWIAVQRY